MGISNVKPRATELLARMGGGKLYREAKEQGLSLSAFLEQEDESDDDERRQGSDAFQRLIRAEGIVTTTDPGGSWYAAPIERFGENDRARDLFPEWAARQWRRAQLGTRAPAQYLSSDFALGTIQRPYTDIPDLRQQQVQPAIPLSEVVRGTLGVDTPDVRLHYLTQPSAAEIRRVRVAESAELPRAKITSGARTLRLRKFGRALEASYEALRRQRIDWLATQIQQMAIQSQVDEVAVALGVAVSGDGNAGTAATNYNLTTLDPAATAGTLTVKGWLAFRLKFINPYALTAAFAREDMALQLELLTTGSANILLAQAGPIGGFGRPFVPMNQSLADGVRLGITDDAPANVIVGMDARFAVDRYVENGSGVNEAERWITRQVEVMTMSENSGMAIFDAQSVRTLTVSA